MMNIEVVDCLQGLDGLRTDWDALSAETDASPYAGFDWCATAARHFARGVPLSIVVVRDGRGVLAILPLERGRERVAMLTQPVLRWAGRWIPFAPVLVAPRAPVAALMEAVLERLCADGGWSYCRMVRLPATSPLLRGAGFEAGRAGVRRVCVPIGQSVVIQIPGTWEAYRATLSPAHRKNLARRTNGLARRGALRLERVGPGSAATAGEVDRWLGAALDVSRRSWQAGARQGRSICAPDVVAFVTDASRRLAARGRLDLSVLYCGDQPVSFIWGAARSPRSTIEKMGFDAEFSEFSPGMVHLGQLIADSAARGITAIDFGHEFPEHKSRWGEPGVALYDLLFYPATMWSRLICWWRHDRRRTAAQALAAAPLAADCLVGAFG